MVGQWLGIHAPERIDRLILCNTSAYLGPAEQFEGRIASVLKANRAETAEMFLRNWFPPNLLDANGPIIAQARAMLLATDPQGFAGSYAAVRDMDMRRTIALITCPTLVIAGHYDTVTLPSHSEFIAAAVPWAKLTQALKVIGVRPSTCRIVSVAEGQWTICGERYISSRRNLARFPLLKPLASGESTEKPPQ